MRALRQRIAEFEAARDAEAGAAEPPRKSPKRRGRKKASIASHPAFVPMVTVWGAALGGCSVLVLPEPTITRLAAASGLAGTGAIAGYLIAAIAALLCGGIAGALAAAIRRSRGGSTGKSGVASKVTELIKPIDPASELGSESLDAPIEEDGADEVTIPDSTEEPEDVDEDPLVLDEAQICEAAEEEETPRGPTLGELAERGYEDEPPVLPEKSPDKANTGIRFTRRDFQEALEATCESFGESEEIVKEEALGRPRELDLAEFADLPGRNAVWVEEDEPQSRAPEVHEIDQPPAPRPAVSAVEKLRQVPPAELSLVQMVERFAVALHEHQDAERKRGHAAGTPKRDAALAEALRALTVLTEGGLDFRSDFGSAAGDDKAAALRDSTRELRDALTKLQNLRGAA